MRLHVVLRVSSGSYGRLRRWLADRHRPGRGGNEVRTARLVEEGVAGGQRRVGLSARELPEDDGRGMPGVRVDAVDRRGLGEVERPAAGLARRRVDPEAEARSPSEDVV